MNFVSHVLSGEEGIQTYYIIGLLIFILLFLIMIIRTVKIPKQDLINYKTSILEKDELESNDII